MQFVITGPAFVQQRQSPSHTPIHKPDIDLVKEAGERMDTACQLVDEAYAEPNLVRTTNLNVLGAR